MADHSNLSSGEVEATRQAVGVLKESDLPWVKGLLARREISRLTNSLEEHSPDCEVRKNIVQKRSHLFELRYAAALAVKGLEAEYEYCSGVGKSSVDFRIKGTNGGFNWLVELVTLRQSEAMKEATHSWNDERVEISVAKTCGNDEAGELIKAQERLGAKVWHDRKCFIKFPKPDDHIHMLFVNADGMLVENTADEKDFEHITFGGSLLDGVYQRHWNGDLVKGLFETSHSKVFAKAIRDRIHIIAFINEANETWRPLDCIGRENGAPAYS